MFLIEEPDPVISCLGDSSSVPLIDGCLRLLPLSTNYSLITPTVPITSPSMGEMRYFASHAVTDIILSACRMVPASCKGSFCDRPNLLSHVTHQCGCFHFERSPGLIIEMDVTFTVPPDFDMNETGIKTIQKFRSWRTSQLFVTGKSWSKFQLDNMNHLQQLRTAIRQVLHYINNNGGWTYIGWLRTGKVLDQSDNSVGSAAENLASMTQNPHISYLYPSNTNTIDLAIPEFRDCLLNLDEDDQVPAPANNQQPAPNHQPPARAAQRANNLTAQHQSQRQHSQPRQQSQRNAPITTTANNTSTRSSSQNQS